MPRPRDIKLFFSLLATISWPLSNWIENNTWVCVVMESLFKFLVRRAHSWDNKLKTGREIPCLQAARYDFFSSNKHRWPSVNNKKIQQMTSDENGEQHPAIYSSTWQSGAKGEWRSGTDWKCQTHVEILVILWLCSGLENLAKHHTFNNK